MLLLGFCKMWFILFKKFFLKQLSLFRKLYLIDRGNIEKTRTESKSYDNEAEYSELGNLVFDNGKQYKCN